MLSLLSLFLGLAAWALPLTALMRSGFMRPVAVCCLSFLLCALVLWLQLLGLSNLCDMGDWAAVGDTVGVLTFAGGVLLFGTAFSNFALLFIRTKSDLS